MASTIRTIHLTCDGEDHESLLAIVKELEPSWEYLATQRLTGGVNNTLFKVTRKNSESEKAEGGEALLVRIYGGSSGILVNREWELECHVLLQKYGLAPRIAGRFNNGYAYGFVPGKVCTPSDLVLEPVWRGIARRMAEWHAVLPQNLPPTQSIWHVLEKWVEALPNSTEEEKKRRHQLEIEGGLMKRQFCQTKVQGMPNLVFTHCDLLAGNIVIKPKNSTDAATEGVEEVGFIDFEYAMMAPAAFDIASHFSEWVGFECDYNLLPPRSLRRQFLMEYTSTYNSLRGPEERVINLDDMCDEVDRFRGLPGYMWGIAALIQAQVSTDDFDFKRYAHVRIEEHEDWKAETEGARAEAGGEMPLRERCWAREDWT